MIPLWLRITLVLTLNFKKMAKSTMALGQYRGKMGGLVFRKGDGGQQIISAYQPIVKNPRSDGQMSQRAKFNLGVQITKQVPIEFIYSLGTSTRGRRAALLSSIVKSSTAIRNGNAYNASVNGVNVVISKGANAAALNPQGSYNNQNRSVVVSYQDIDGINGWQGTDKVSSLILICSVDGSVAPLAIPVPDAADISSRTFEYAIPSNYIGSNFKAMVWVFATRQGSNVNSATGADATIPNNSLSASLSLGTGLSSLEYSDSMFAGVFALEG